MNRIATFDDLIRPDSAEEFFAKAWGRVPTIWARDFDVIPIMSWDELNELLARHRFEYPRLRLSQDGDAVPVDAYCDDCITPRGRHISRLSIHRLHRLLSNGAVLSIDALDEIVPSIEELATNIERTLGEVVRVNGYAGFGEGFGLGLHWDDHDVFVCQLYGSKEWTVYGSTTPYPMRWARESVGPVPTAEPILKTTLKAGDTLYIPRGFWHIAHAIGVETFHLTYSITNRTGLDWVEHLAERLKGFELFRQDLPRFANADIQERHMIELERLLLHESGNCTLAEFLARTKALQSGARRRPSLPWAVTGFVKSENRSTYTIRWRGAQESGVISAISETTHDTLLAIARMLQERRRISLDALHILCADGGIDVSTVDNMVESLIVAGLVSVEPSGSTVGPRH